MNTFVSAAFMEFLAREAHAPSRVQAAGATALSVAPTLRRTGFPCLPLPPPTSPACDPEKVTLDPASRHPAPQSPSLRQSWCPPSKHGTQKTVIGRACRTSAV